MEGGQVDMPVVLWLGTMPRGALFVLSYRVNTPKVIQSTQDPFRDNGSHNYAPSCGHRWFRNPTKTETAVLIRSGDFRYKRN